MIRRRGATTAVALLALLPSARAGADAAARICIARENGLPRARVEGPAWPRPVDLDLGRGRGCFYRVPPGEQRVVMEAPGVPAASLDLEVLPGERIELRARADGAGSALELAGRYRPGLGTPFGARRLRELPGGGEAWSLLETVEPVAIADRIDGGGLWTGVPGRSSTHGSSWTQTSFAVGMLDVTDPLRTGTPLVWPDAHALEAFDVATGAMGADVGAPGAHVTLYPAASPSRWSAMAEAGTTLGEGRAQGPPSSTPTDGPEPPVARFGHRRRAALAAGGPLAGALRLSLFGAVEDARRFERGEPDALDGHARSAGASATWTPHAGQELRAGVRLDSLERPFAGRFRFAERGLQERDRLLGANAAWRARGDSGLVASIALGHRSGSWEGEAGTAGGTFERLVHGPAPELPLPGEADRRRSDAAFAVDLPPRRALGGWHAVRLGVQGALTRARTSTQPGPLLAGELLGGRPARAWSVSAPGASEWRGTDLALHVSDAIAAGDLHLEPALRLETSGASASAGATDVRWTALSPRVWARWSALEALAVFGFYGRYRHRFPLGLMAWGDAGAPRGETFLWDDASGDRRFQPGEQGTLVARFGPGAPVGALDGSLRPPRTEEVVVGAEARLGRWRVALVGIHREERDLAESVNVGVPAGSYVVTRVPDPGGDLAGPQDDQLLPLYARSPSTFGADRFLLTNPPGHDTTHQGVELSVELLASRVQVLFGATAHRSDGAGAYRGFRPGENDQALTGDLFDDPNSSTHARGRLFSDRAYTIKLSGSWRAPGDALLGVVARYQDGQPFARLVLAELPQGLTAVQAIQNGRARFTFALTLDARLEKAVDLGRSRKAAVVVEGFNLLQRGHEVEEDAVSGPGYRRVTFRQPPRAIRVGLRLAL